MTYKLIYQVTCDWPGCDAEPGQVVSEHSLPSVERKNPVPEGWRKLKDTEVGEIYTFCPRHDAGAPPKPVPEPAPGLDPAPFDPDIPGAAHVKEDEDGVFVDTALAEGSTVYALLSDGRILEKSFEDGRCAEEAAAQVLRLKLEPEKMLSWFEWREVDPAKLEAVNG